jgi:hypothetical protein
MSEAQEILLKHIKDNQPIEQSKLIEFFLYAWEYKSMMSARNAIGKILQRLEAQKLIKKEKKDSGKVIKKNVWRTA